MSKTVEATTKNLQPNRSISIKTVEYYDNSIQALRDEEQAISERLEEIILLTTTFSESRNHNLENSVDKREALSSKLEAIQGEIQFSNKTHCELLIEKSQLQQRFLNIAREIESKEHYKEEYTDSLDVDRIQEEELSHDYKENGKANIKYAKQILKEKAAPDHLLRQLKFSTSQFDLGNLTSKQQLDVYKMLRGCLVIIHRIYEQEETKDWS